MASQLPLPLESVAQLGREDFIVAPANAEAIAFIDTWPNWPVPLAAFYGPAGAGKSHLIAIWREAAGADVVPAAELTPSMLAARDTTRPLAVEDVDSARPSEKRDTALFTLLERAGAGVPLLLSGREPPAQWCTFLPDLASRFSAVLAFALWAPDDALLTGLARKLFTDRQLVVPDPVIVRMIRSLERSPVAVRDFVALADSRALAEAKPVNLALVRKLLAERDEASS